MVLPKILQPYEFIIKNIFDPLSICLKFVHLIIFLRASVIFWIQFWESGSFDDAIMAASDWLSVLWIGSVP